MNAGLSCVFTVRLIEKLWLVILWHSREPISLSSCLKQLEQNVWGFAEFLHLCKNTAFAWVWNWSVSNRYLGVPYFNSSRLLYTWKKERKTLRQRQRDMNIQSYILPPCPGDFPSQSVTYSYLMFITLLKCDANLNSSFFHSWLIMCSPLSFTVNLSFIHITGFASQL